MTKFDPKFSEYLPERHSSVHKYSRGRVGILAGSSLYPGAAMLSARGAARAGAGYANLYVPSCISQVCQSALPSVVVGGLEDVDGHIKAGCERDIADVAKFGAFVAGSGLGRGEDQQSVLESLIKSDVVLVVDADLIELLTSVADSLGGTSVWSRKLPLVVTPHRGELKKLASSFRTLGKHDDINSWDVSRVADFCSEFLKSVGGTNTIIVAKGDVSCVVTAENQLFPTCGDDTLATAGSGDVLAGSIGGLLSQSHATENCDVANICAAAIETSALAGKIATKQYGHRGVMAPDIADSLGLAIDKLTEE